MKRFRILTLSALALCILAVGGVIVAQKLTRQTRWQEGTITYDFVVGSPDGTTKRTGYYTRETRSNGEWKERQIKFDENNNPYTCGLVYSDVDGIFMVNNEKQVAIQHSKRGARPDFVFEEKKFMANPFAKPGPDLLGYRTIMQKIDLPEGETYEAYFAPDLNGTMVRTVQRYPDGSYEETVATEIKPGRVNFEKRPNFPVTKAYEDEGGK